MVEACPIPTPEEAKYAAILSRIEATLHAEIARAIDSAFAAAVSELAAAVPADKMPAPPRGYFVSVAHQALFCELCGADRATLQGGDASVAVAIVKNYQGLTDSWAQNAG
ncbi:hypothetical protein X566_13885 [Afipia sp. P52-10]|uniref:hypothetical protein n=1 Tax=Afipia sp. P52-10 TaxID=1429916 RepID=UPI0003DEFE35|nr:hypothetical protein [Afipia sp. P52-10]ETR78628.1 hypothetical protein X566_13885 [Afipia sp. P52-10]